MAGLVGNKTKKWVEGASRWKWVGVRTWGGKLSKNKISPGGGNGQAVVKEQRGVLKNNGRYLWDGKIRKIGGERGCSYEIVKYLIHIIFIL